MNGRTLLLVLVLVGATGLAALGIITGEAWIGLVVGSLLVPSAAEAVGRR